MSAKLATLVVATMLFAQAFAAEQLFGVGEPVAVIRMSMSSDDDSNGGMFPAEFPSMFNMPPPPPPPMPFFGPDLFSSFMRNLFDDAPVMSDEEQPEGEEGPTIIRVSITSSSSSSDSDDSESQDSQEQPRQMENPFGRFSAVFRRMASMIEDLRSRAMTQLDDQSSFDAAPIRRNCALLRVCADEIDQLCAAERLTNIPGAIPLCLAKNREQLGDDCRAMLDKRTGAGSDDEEGEGEDENEGDAEEENGDNSSVVITPIEDEPGMEIPEGEIPSTEVPADQAPADSDMIEPEYEPEQPAADENDDDVTPAAELEQPEDAEPAPATEAPAAAAESNNERPCKADVDTFCATEKANIAQTHLVGVMACLHRHQSQLSAQCLAALEPTAAFHCAEDAEQLCPGVRGRQLIARCLHGSADKVSDECKKAAHKHGVSSMRFVTQSVRAETAAEEPTAPAPAQDGLKVQAAMDTPVSQELPAHVWPIAIAGGCFVLVVSLVAVIAYRRRRMQQELPVTITLNNPSQSSAVLSSEPLPYSPRAQERL